MTESSGKAGMSLDADMAPRYQKNTLSDSEAYSSSVSDTDVVIVAAVRTPIGRYAGALAKIRPDDLAALVIKSVVERSSVDPLSIDDVIMGCTNQAGEDNRNVGRLASLLAGLPIEVPGQTVNRLCGSGLQAIISAFHAIKAGEAKAVIAGGVESMTRSPWVTLKSEEAYSRAAPQLTDSTIGWRFTNTKFPKEWIISMGETAENVAEKYSISREEQDAFAFQSQQKTAAAIDNGMFTDEIVPVSVPAKGGKTILVNTDEHPRSDITMEKLESLKPAFKLGGTVTAGSSSGINDGAAAVLVMNYGEAKRQGLKPIARILSSAVVGVSPEVMGIGPVPAVKKALQRADLTIDQIDLVELNEAFAAQALACIQELGIDPSKINVNGGGIALGHPLGSSGARIVTTLTHEMTRRRARYGIATMCIGVGQGIAAVFERVGK